MMRRGLVLLAVCAACVVQAKEPAAEYTCYNVVPLPLDDVEVETAAADILDYRAKTGCREVLVMLTLNPVGCPAIDNARWRIGQYAKLKRALAGADVRVGALLQAIIGHGWVDASDKCESWQREINVNGVPSRYCIMDEGYRAYIRECARLIAETKPAFFMSDDDCRNNQTDTTKGFKVVATCFCPLCTAAFNRMKGTSYTPEAYREAVAKSKPGDAMQADFGAFSERRMCSMLKIFREELDKVDPTIPGIASEGNHARESVYVEGYAKTLAAKGQEPVIRISSGKYLERTMYDFSGYVRLMMGCTINHEGVIPVLLDESDTCPHNLWSKSSVGFASHMYASVFAGCRGAKMWYVNMRKNGLPVSRNYTTALAKAKRRLDALVGVMAESKPYGVAVPCREEFKTVNDAVGFHHDRPPTWDRWTESLFGIMGVPFYATFDKKTDGHLYAIGGADAVDRFTDRELKELLAHRCLVDSLAARALVKRGFGELIGVKALEDGIRFEWEEDVKTGEKATFSHATPEVPGFATVGDTETLTMLRRKVGVERRADVAPGAFLCRNRLGGRVLVTAWHWKPFIFQRADESRQRWLNRMLGYLHGDGAFDNTVLNAQDTMALARRRDDGSVVLGAFNLNPDPIGTLLVSRRTRPASVGVMDETGSFSPVPFEWKDGVLSVPQAIHAYDVAILEIR